MIKFPKDFVKTKYNGYFWNIEEELLYSIKVGGELRPMKLHNSNRWLHFYEPHFRCSVNGKNRYYRLSELMKLKMEDSVFPMKDKV